MVTKVYKIHRKEGRIRMERNTHLFKQTCSQKRTGTLQKIRQRNVRRLETSFVQTYGKDKRRVGNSSVISNRKIQITV